MNNATRGARAVGLALALLVAAPSAAQAGWSHRMHWRGLHSPWPAHASASAVPTGDGANGVTFDDATRTVYVANVLANTISVIDGARCNADRTRGCDGPVATLPDRRASGRDRGRRPHAHAVCDEHRRRDGRPCSTSRPATRASSPAAAPRSRPSTSAASPIGIAIDPAERERLRRQRHHRLAGRDRRRDVQPRDHERLRRGRAGDHGRVLVVPVRRPRLAHDLRARYRAGRQRLGGGERAHLQCGRGDRLRASRRHPHRSAPEPSPAGSIR